MPLDIVNKTFSDIITFSRATTGTYYDSSGILKTAAINEKRFDHDPLTLQPKGLLVEKSRSNILYYSNDLTNTGGYWIRNNCSVSLGWPSPDGGYNANRITGTSLDCSISQSFTPPAASPNPCTFSFWIKSASFIGQPSITIKMLKGTSQTLVASATITPSPWTWTRVSLTGDLSGFLIGASTVVIGGDASFGFNESYYIFGTQLEQGNFASSYIPTTDGTTTRADDVVEVKVGNWLNDKEGTLFIDSIPAKNPLNLVLLDRIDSVAFTLYDSKSVDQYTSYHTNLSYVSDTNPTGKSSFDVKNAGAVQVYLQSTSNYSEGINKMIGAYKENDFAFTLNGDAVQTDTQGSVPTLDKARIGNSWFLQRGFTGWIRRIAYYPRRLSNEELQSLTVV